MHIDFWIGWVWLLDLSFYCFLHIGLLLLLVEKAHHRVPISCINFTHNTELQKTVIKKKVALMNECLSVS